MSQLSSDPVLREIEIKHIEIDPKQKCWTIVFSGEPTGSHIFWDQLATKLTASIKEITKIKFQWETKLSDDSDNDYMANLVKNFKGPEITQNSIPEKKSRRRGRRNAIDKQINNSTTEIKQITHEENGIVIHGEVTAYDQRQTRSGKYLIMFDVYDHSDTITCKLFVNDQEDIPKIDTGCWYKVQGDIQYQTYDNELSLMVRHINPGNQPPKIEDNAEVKRVELHLHTKMSSLDGVLDLEDVIKLAADWKHRALAITDHGVVQSFPAAYNYGKKYGVKIFFGLEGYLIDQESDHPYHIILLAKNQTGLKNLYKLVSYSHLDHFYYRPRIPRDLLNEHREGLIVGSACEAGEVYKAVLNRDPKALEIAKYYDYLEIQPIGNNEFLVGTEYVKSFSDLEQINIRICELGKQLNKPIVATGDVHFLRPEDSLYRAILLMGQGYQDAERQAPLYYRTTEEMLQEFTYLGPELAKEVVITAPNKIADQIGDVVPIPEKLHPPIIPEAETKLQELCYETARSLYGESLPDIVAKRLDKELKAIIGNGFAALYWTAHKLVDKSNQDGYMVGSRGSVGSSFAATMSGITEVNPLPPHYLCPKCHHSEFFTNNEVGSGVDLPAKNCPQCNTAYGKDGFDIPFEVFLGFHGDKVPDIDLNFSGEYQANIQKYTEELFGSDHVFRAGTVGTIAEKTAYGFVMKYYEQTGQSKRNAEVNRVLKKITGVKRTTGQHPGGMIVVPHNMDIFDFTPIQRPANDNKSEVTTTHFEYSYMEDSLVKLDNLGHDGPTMMRMFDDLGEVKSTEIPLDDLKTMAVFNSLASLDVTEEQIGTPIGTLGVPEFGTPFVRQMLTDIRPTTFADLVDIMGLSHGTDVWLNNAQVLIKNKTTDFANVIACRDDIMVYLIHKGLDAGDAFQIMEQVRKGRGLSDEDVALMKKHQVPDWYISSCYKIKYMFPKAHAVAYAFTAYRSAYFKVHYPAIFYATYFTLKVDDVNADLIISGENKVREEIANINAKGNDATAKEKNVLTNLEIVIEAMMRGIEFLPVDLYDSDPVRVIPQANKLLLPLASLDGVGVNAAQNIADARTAGEFLSIEDVRLKSKVTKTVIEAMQQHGCFTGLPETNQLSLF